MDDAASRFWDKYILKTVSYNVPEGARRWYVRHAEVFIKAQSGRRLSTLTADDIERYLKEKGRSEKLTDWQFRQMVDALRILFARRYKQFTVPFNGQLAVWQWSSANGALPVTFLQAG